MSNQITSVTSGVGVGLLLKPVVWELTGLKAYVVYLVYQNDITDTTTGEIVAYSYDRRVIEAHWQENVARACITRWSKFYNLPILMGEPLYGRLYDKKI